MNVAWGLRWGESRSTQPCVFPGKVAAGGDEKVPHVCDGCGYDRLERESVPPLRSATSGCSCARLSHAFLESLVADRSAMLHDCCRVSSPCAWRDSSLPCDAAKRSVMAA